MVPFRVLVAQVTAEQLQSTRSERLLSDIMFDVGNSDTFVIIVSWSLPLSTASFPQKFLWIQLRILHYHWSAFFSVAVLASLRHWILRNWGAIWWVVWSKGSENPDRLTVNTFRLNMRKGSLVLARKLSIAKKVFCRWKLQTFVAPINFHSTYEKQHGFQEKIHARAPDDQ